MKLLLDTNKYTDLARGDNATLSRIETAEELWISVITLGELRSGFVGGSRTEENQRMLANFLSQPNCGVILLNEATTTIYATIVVALRRLGTPIPTNDIWIAAQALQHDLTLDTRDHHFRHVPGLKLASVNP